MQEYRFEGFDGVEGVGASEDSGDSRDENEVGSLNGRVAIKSKISKTSSAVLKAFAVLLVRRCFDMPILFVCRDTVQFFFFLFTKNGI